MDTNKKKLDDFTWDQDEDFFGIKEERENEEVEEQKKKLEEEKKKKLEDEGKTPEELEKEKKEKEENIFFGEELGEEEESRESEEENEEEEEEEEEEENKSDNIFKDLYEDLKEQGIIDLELEEEEVKNLDAESFFELQEKNIEKQIDDRITGMFEEMPDEAKDFLRYMRDGGNPKDYIEVVRDTLEEGDIEDEEYQNRIIEHQLAKEGWDEDEIESRLEYYKDSGKKKSIATKYQKKIKRDEEARKANLIKEAERNREFIKKQKEDFRNDISESLDEIKEIKGFEFNKAEKKELLNYLTQEKYSISKTKKVTGFQKELSEALRDKEKLLLIAKLLKSDFDTSSIKKKTITKETKKIKSKLERRSGLRPNSSGSSNTKGKSLADLF